MESNEYTLLYALIMYHRNKNLLDLETSIKQVNDRINKLTDRVNELLDELKPIVKTPTFTTHGNWNNDEEFDYTNR